MAWPRYMGVNPPVVPLKPSPPTWANAGRMAYVYLCPLRPPGPPGSAAGSRNCQEQCSARPKNTSRIKPRSGPTWPPRARSFLRRKAPTWRANRWQYMPARCTPSNAGPRRVVAHEALAGSLPRHCFVINPSYSSVALSGRKHRSSPTRYARPVPAPPNTYYIVPPCH